MRNYILLDEGDEVIEGDEWWDDWNGVWKPAVAFGETNGRIPYRRESQPLLVMRKGIIEDFTGYFATFTIADIDGIEKTMQCPICLEKINSEMRCGGCGFDKEDITYNNLLVWLSKR